MGLRYTGSEPQGFEVWPENWKTLEIYAAMCTQWNEGFNGRIGLRYEALPGLMRSHQVPSADRRFVERGIRIMEAAELSGFKGI